MRLAYVRRGVSLSEYGIIGALVAVLAYYAVSSLGTVQMNNFCKLSYRISFADNPQGASGCNRVSGYGKGANYGFQAFGGWGCQGSTPPSGCVLIDDQFLYKMNQQFPIQSVYGLKNASGNIVSTYTDALNTIRTSGSTDTARYYGVVDPSNGKSFQYEIQTSNGDQYGVFWAGDTYGAVNLVTGNTYTMTSSGSLVNIGKTNISGMYGN